MKGENHAPNQSLATVASSIFLRLKIRINKMMKYLFYFFVVFVIAVTAKPASDKYTNKYDNIDLDEILSNERLFNNYFACLIEAGKCTPDGAELKASLPDAIATECSRCTEKQKKGSEKVIKFLIEKKPEKWTVLEKKYDPNGVYKAKYQDTASKLGIKL